MSLGHLPSSSVPAASPVACEVWDAIVAPKYVAFEERLVAAALAHEQQVWDRIPPAANAADIGCGSGDSAARLAAQCGSVVAIDCSAPLLNLAQARYGAVPNLTFTLGDVGRYEPTEALDLCYSRFGLMFFERPVATLRKVRSWLRPGGALRGLVWASRDLNPWLTLAQSAVCRHVPAVNDGAPSCGPGPFSMAEPETTRAMLKAAGFCNVRLRRLTVDVFVGGNAEDASAFQLALGPAGEVMRHARDARHPGVSRARTAARAKLSEAAVSGGDIVLPSASWWIEAEAPR